MTDVRLQHISVIYFYSEELFVNTEVPNMSFDFNTSESKFHLRERQVVKYVHLCISDY